jgi:predicted DNA binding CopG/RHH family protein
MKKKIGYSDESIGKPRVIADFLPEPHELVLKDDTVKVTIALSRQSVEFFKRVAHQHHTPYQKMIRRLLDAYAVQHKDAVPATRRKR